MQAKFAATLKKFRDANAYCNTFGRLWGAFDPLDESWCDYYLEVLGHVIRAPTAFPTEEIVFPVKQSMAIMVRSLCAPRTLISTLVGITHSTLWGLRSGQSQILPGLVTTSIGCGDGAEVRVSVCQSPWFLE